MKTTRLDERYNELLNEDNSRIKNKIIEKLKVEGGMPQGFWDGRMSNDHTAAKEVDREFEDGRNFQGEFSGQPDLDESAMGDVRTMASETKSFKKFVNAVFNEFRDLEETKESIKWLKSIFDDVVTEMVTESTMGDLDIMATEAKNFKEFAKDVFKEFKDLKKTKESVEWLQSVYDSSVNESINEAAYKSATNNELAMYIINLSNEILGERDPKKVKFLKKDRAEVAKELKNRKKSNESITEGVTFSVDDIAPMLIPSSERTNKQLHKELANVINKVLQKHGVISIKLKELNESNGFNKNFIPNIGNIDDHELKNILTRNKKFLGRLSPEEKKFFLKKDVVVAGSGFNLVFTDGKMDFGYDNKKREVVRPLGKARKQILNHWKEMGESVKHN